MVKNLYIFSIGRLFRKHNNVYFKSKDGNKKALKIESLSSIYIMNKVSFTYNALKLLLDRNISIHFFYESKKKGISYYLGSLLPRKKFPSGIMTIKQVQHYLDEGKRCEIALELIDATRYNMIKAIEKYNNVQKEIELLKNFNPRSKFIESYRIKKNKNIGNVLRGIEGEIWDIFYTAIGKILKRYTFDKRTKRPPKNEINCLISFLNTLLYTHVLSEINKTHLDPTISFLHEPRSVRYSLALDFSENFKPIITFRTLIWLVNQDVIKDNHFVKGLEGILLNEKGKKIVIEHFEKRMDRTVKIKGYGRKSIRSFIRKQAYALEKAILEESKFKAFRFMQ